MAIHAIGASSGPDGWPCYARNDRIPMVHSLRSSRDNQVILSFLQYAHFFKSRLSLEPSNAAERGLHTDAFLPCSALNIAIRSSIRRSRSFRIRSDPS